MKKEDLRIVFLGTPEFAVESLEAIHNGNYNIVAIVTMPDKPAGRGHKLLQSPVKLWGVEHNIPVLQPVNLKDPEFVNELKGYNANLFIVIAFRMLPEVVWKMPELGTFNLHASLLPRYRGAAPINRAIMNGDTTTGVTTFFLKHEIDTGDIISQEAIEIGEDEDAGSLHDRLMTLGARLTLDTLDRIIKEDLQPIPQEQLLTNGEEPTPAPKIFREDCRIDWKKTAKQVKDFVRGLSPYPAAWATMAFPGLGNVDTKIFQVKISDDRSSLLPGNMKIKGNSIVVGTGEGNIEIQSLGVPGKKRMDVAAFLNGLQNH